MRKRKIVYFRLRGRFSGANYLVFAQLDPALRFPALYHDSGVPWVGLKMALLRRFSEKT